MGRRREETGSEDSLDTITGRRAITCKYCGEEPLYWMSIDERWRLVDDKNVPHSCEEFKEAVKAQRNKEFES